MDRREFIIVSTGSLVLTAASAKTVAAENIDFGVSFVFQGQPVTASGDAITPEATYNLREVESFSNGEVVSSRNIDDIDADEDGFITIETGSLEEADYFIRGEGLPDNPDAEKTFEIATQTLDVSVEHDIVEQGLGTELEIDSNRGTYTVEVESDSLTTDELARVLTDYGRFELAENQPDSSGHVRLKDGGDRTGLIGVTDLDPGVYSFDFSVADTTAADSVTISVEEGDHDVEVWAPEKLAVEPGNQFHVPIRVDGTSNGVGGYSLEAEVEFDEVAAFDDIDLVGVDADDSAVELEISDTILSMTVDELDFPSGQELKLATLILTAFDGEGTGHSHVEVTNISLEDDDGESYNESIGDPTSVLVREIDEEVVDATGEVWQGQLAIVDREEIKANEVYSLRAAESFDDGYVDSSSFIEEIEASDNGTLEIDTSELTPDHYFIRGEGLQTPAHIDETFEVVVQEIQTEFSSEHVESGDSVTLTLESNRDEAFSAIISSNPSLDDPGFLEMFVERGGFDLADSHFGNESVIEVSAGGVTTGEVSFDGVAEGEYTFNVETLLPGATDGTGITVTESSVPDGAAFEVEIMEPEDGADVDHDEFIRVAADITNVGDSAGEQPVFLTGPVTDSTDGLEIGATDSKIIEFGIPAGEIEEGDEISITVESEYDEDTVSVTATDPCFIATAAYGTETATEIDVLRDFRDDILKTNWLGRRFVTLYYSISPPIGDWMRASGRRRRIVREGFVGPLVSLVDRVRQSD